jgi:hypothetical protein
MIGWSQRYWGGLVAVAGGALVLGALRRLVRRPRTRHAVVLGIGLGILANSRPYEGLVLSLPFLIALGVWLLTRRGPPLGAALRRILLPAGGVVAIVASGMLYYNYRVTGDPLTMPYFVHERTYVVVPTFRFQDPRPVPTYRHERLLQFFAGVEAPSRTEFTVGALVAGAWSRLEELGGPAFGSFFVAIAVGILLPLERSGWYHIALLVLGVFLLGCGAQHVMFPHYAAPAVGLTLLLTLRALRHVGVWRPAGLRLGLPLVHAVCLFMVSWLAIGSWSMVRAWREADWQYERARIATEFSRSGRRHLVIVRPVPTYPLMFEWVYNGADIDAAPVVWARDMGREANARLLDYFRDRQVWLVEPDHWEVRRAPYPGREPSSPWGAATGG